MSRYAWLTLLATGAGLALAAWSGTRPRQQGAAHAPRPDAAERAASGQAGQAPPRRAAGRPSQAGPHGTPPVSLGQVEWLAAGGGAEPASNQISLEQDIALAAQVFGPGGLVLFAGGPHTYGVQVLDDTLDRDDLLDEIARILDPRDGRDSRYQRPTLAADGPATAPHVLETLASLVAVPTAAPLLVYVAGHGEQGEQPHENLVRLWGGWAFTAHELAAHLDAAAKRPTRFVMTTCYSGGFAELAFRGADAALGAPAVERCGLFASTWDREASGCDPDPDRRAQESYGIHFLHALAGVDRHGEPVARAEIDFDGDGSVSLLEAHTRARIVSASFDVPTTTSERWLRAMAPEGEREADLRLPEEDALIAALGARTGLLTEAAAVHAFEGIDEQYGTLATGIDERQGEIDDLFSQLRIGLLERWPVLDDPFHPEFSGTVREQRTAIAAYLDAAPERQELALREADLAPDVDRLSELQVQLARVERLVRAHETRRLSRRLKAEGGPGLLQYERLLTCERGRAPRGRSPLGH